MMKLARTVALLVAVAALVASLAVSAAPGKTLDNLQAAFNGESNAHAKYLAYSKKADEEGYPSVASLFRAASIRAVVACPFMPCGALTANCRRDHCRRDHHRRRSCRPAGRSGSKRRSAAGPA